MPSPSLICSWCGDEFKIRVAEFNRRRKHGKNRFFCCRSCAVCHQNEARENKRVPITKKCPHCRNTFKTMSGSKSPANCSRSCASAGSVTPKRLAAARMMGGKNASNINTIQSIANGLRVREWRKYEKLDAYLKRKKVVHVFEFPLPRTRYIFDLALVGLKTLVEFDGIYHKSMGQVKTDQQKDAVAKRRGWRVVRVLERGDVLSPRSLSKVV